MPQNADCRERDLQDRCSGRGQVQQPEVLREVNRVDRAGQHPPDRTREKNRVRTGGWPPPASSAAVTEYPRTLPLLMPKQYPMGYYDSRLQPNARSTPNEMIHKEYSHGLQFSAHTRSLLPASRKTDDQGREPVHRSSRLPARPRLTYLSHQEPAGIPASRSSRSHRLGVVHTTGVQLAHRTNHVEHDMSSPARCD